MSEAPMTQRDAILAAETVYGGMKGPSGPDHRVVSVEYVRAAHSMAAFILQHREDWQPIETAPLSTIEKRVRVLVWVEDFPTMAFGYIFEDHKGERYAQADSFCGTWKIRLWHPVPAGPSPAIGGK